MPANTGAAGANYRVEFFAGLPAPTGIARVLKSGVYTAPNSPNTNAYSRATSLSP